MDFLGSDLELGRWCRWRWPFRLTRRKRQVYDNQRISIEHADGFAVAEYAVGTRAQFVVGIHTQAAEPELAIFLNKVRANLQTLRIFQ